MTHVPIRLTEHATTRLSRVHADDPRARALADVRMGLRHGRTAKHQPRWALDAGHSRTDLSRAEKRNGKGGKLRWTWDEAQANAYLVDVSRSDLVRIITILEAA
jgi:hypothetical protein